MSDKTKQNIYEYIQKYLHQKQKHEYIDYYELFGFSEKLTIDEIQKELKYKKIRKLFHPDQVAYIESVFKDTFNECVSTVINAEKVFSNDLEKMKYDSQLAENKKLYKDIEVTTKEKNMLETAIITTVFDKGFYNGYKALKKAVNNDFSIISTENNSRKMAEELGSVLIKEILNSEKKDIMNTDMNDIIMDYYLKIINKTGLKEKTDTFYDICIETVENPKLDAYNSIYESFQKEKFSILSRNRTLRKKFENLNFTKNDVSILMLSRLHSKSSNNEKYKFSNTITQKRSEITKMFVDQIKNEINQKKENKTI